MSGEISRRHFLSLAALASLALTGCAGASRFNPFELRVPKDPEGKGSIPDASFAPYLTHVLQFLKTQTTMVCLGDTDHRKSGPYAYLFNKKTLDDLAKAGYENVMVEAALLYEQNCYDSLQDLGADWKRLSRFCAKKLYQNEHIPKEDRLLLSDRLEEALKGRRSPRYYTVDQREYGFNDTQEAYLKSEKATADYIVKTLKKDLHQCVSGEGHRTHTTVLAYGMAHLTRITTKGKEGCLYDELKAAGLKPLSVSLYLDQGIQKDFEWTRERHPAYLHEDVTFMAYGDKPSVAFQDKALEEKYRAWDAVQNNPHSPTLITQAKIAPTLSRRAVLQAFSKYIPA